MVVLPRAIWVDVDDSPQCFSVQSVLLHQTLYMSTPQSLLCLHCSLHCVPSCHPYRTSFPAASLLSPTHVIRMQDGLDSFQLAVTAGHANIVMHLVQRHNVRVAMVLEVSTALYSVILESVLYIHTLYVQINVCTCMCMYVCMCVCMYVRTYVCVCVYDCVHFLQCVCTYVFSSLYPGRAYSSDACCFKRAQRSAGGSH